MALTLEVPHGSVLVVDCGKHTAFLRFTRRNGHNKVHIEAPNAFTVTRLGRAPEPRPKLRRQSA